MEFTPFQKEILDFLKENPESTAKMVIDATNISKSTVSNELRFLSRVNELICDNTRQPYTYSLNHDSETLEWRKAVVQVKRILLSDDEANNSALRTLQKVPRSEWPAWRKMHLQIAEALKELEDEGRAIDTLEITHGQRVPAKV